MSLKEDSQEYYSSEYDTPMRFISYSEQVRSVKDLCLPGSSVLNLGKGSGFLSSYMANQGYRVVDVDLDERLNPDVVSDIREFQHHITESFDLTCAFQILEHVEYKHLLPILENMSRFSDKILISLPEISPYIHVKMHVPFMARFFRRDYLDLSWTIRYMRKNPAGEEHFWEIGSAGITRESLREDLKKKFAIIKEWPCRWNRSHRFYILVKKYET